MLYSDSTTRLTPYSISVLLIDDQAIIGEALRRMLAAEKTLTFHFCSDPTKAVRTALEVRPTVILQDLVMPDIDGLTLVRAFRETEATRDIPLIVLSTTDEPKVKAQAFALGANDYMVKLPDKLEVLARIRYHSRGYINLLNKNEAYRALLESQEALQKAKEQAEAATRAKSDFLACMSHDIRTPMNAIIGMTDVLAETTLTVEQKNYLNIVRASGEALLSLINDVLDFSKIEAGQLALEKINVDLRDMLEKVVSITSVRAREKRINIRLELGAGVPRNVYGDPTRIRQILINLIGNAVKFTSNEGDIVVRVLVRAETSGTDPITLQFSVKDSGIGIPKDRQDKLFKKFSQVDASTTRKYGGTGLGLAICKQLVEMMGGIIWVESEEGKGSTFIFTIALKPNREMDERVARESEKIAVNGAQPPAATIPLKILLVDDTPENLLLLELYLKKSGHQLDTAANGQIAFEKARAGEYDLAFMDIQMPVMDGFTATREIRRWEQSANRSPMPIIALSADASNDDVTRSLNAGCTHHLAKPIRKAKLLETVQVYERKQP